MDMRSYVQKKKPFRNGSWCRGKQLWTVGQWYKVIWSHESLNRKNCKYVRRQPFEKDCAFNFQPRLQGGGGCFTAAGPGPILFYDGRLDSAAYVRILSAALPQFIEDQFGNRGNDYYFMHDNAPCHSAKATTEWLQSQQIRVLSWPPTSPDLNPIENVWSIIDQELSKMKINSIDQLKEAILKIWYDIPEDTWKRLVTSLSGSSGRIQKVFKVKGRSCCKY